MLPIVFITSGAVYSLQYVARIGGRFNSPTFMTLLALIMTMAFVGFIDDLIGSRLIGGLRGHLSQIRFGILTTGALKAVVGLAVSVVISAAVSNTVLIFLLNLGVLTLSINAANLFDLRPGRAIKVFGGASLAVFIFSYSSVFWGYWGFIIPPIAGLLWGDLKQKTMMGDSGSNALGAILGLSFVINLTWPANLIIFGVLVALHLVAERYSINTFIEKTPVIRELDGLGWKR